MNVLEWEDLLSGRVRFRNVGLFREGGDCVGNRNEREEMSGIGLCRNVSLVLRVGNLVVIGGLKFIMI